MYLCEPPGVAVSTAWASISSTANTKRPDAGKRGTWPIFEKLFWQRDVKRFLTGYDESEYLNPIYITF